MIQEVQLSTKQFARPINVNGVKLDYKPAGAASFLEYSRGAREMARIAAKGKDITEDDVKKMEQLIEARVNFFKGVFVGREDGLSDEEAKKWVEEQSIAALDDYMTQLNQNQ